MEDTNILRDKVLEKAFSYFSKRGVIKEDDYPLIENAIDLCVVHGIKDIIIFDSPQDIINKYGSNMETKHLLTMLNQQNRDLRRFKQHSCFW